MRLRTYIVSLLLVIFRIAPIYGQAWWDAPSEKWTRSQVAKMFNDSPWAQTQTYSAELARKVEGEKEINNRFTVRLFSARPIREAYVRMLQIMNNYDSLPPERRRDFDSRVNGLLRADVSDEVVVAVAFTSNSSDANLSVKRFLGTATTETLNQSVYLYSPVGRLELRKYIPPGQEGSGARFIFPRLQNGKPVLEPGKQELRFDLYVPPIHQRLLVGFKASEMFYKGELAY